MNVCTNNDRVQADIERLFVRGLSPKRHEALRAHLDSCQHCVAFYERMRGVEDALSPELPLSPSAADRLSELVVPDAKQETRQTAWWVSGLLAGAVSTTLLVMAIVPGGEQLQEDTIVARGAATTAMTASLTLFEVLPALSQVKPITASDNTVTLPGETLVQFAYSNESYAYLRIVGIDQNLEPQFYETAPSVARGIALNHNAKLVPVEQAWRFEAELGTVKVVGIFSNEPVKRSVIERALEDLRARGVTLEQLESLPIPKTQQHSVLVRIAP